LIPKNKKQLAVALYNQTVRELQNDSNEWLNFLKFSAKVHKYSFREQVLLFANNPDVELVADFDFWNRHGRRITKYQKSIQIFDSQKNRMQNVFDISQTWGNDLKVFNWDFNVQDKKNLIKHFQETTTNFPQLDEPDDLDFSLQIAISHALNSKISETKIHYCAEYVMMERLGLPVFSEYTNTIRHMLTEHNFNELMAAIDQPVKEILLEIEKTLENDYGKERVSYNERITRTITEPTLPRKPDWATVSSRGSSLQSSTGATGGNLEPVRRDRENVPVEVGGRKSNPSSTGEVRGDVLQERQDERGQSIGADRQAVHDVTREQSSTRDRNGTNSALPDAPPASERDNPSGSQDHNQGYCDTVISEYTFLYNCTW